MKTMTRIMSVWALSGLMVSCESQGPDAATPTAEPAPAPEHASPSAITLSTQERERAGIEVQPLKAEVAADVLTGQATVLGRDVFAQSLAELRMTEATAVQSTAALKRFDGLRSTPGAVGEDVLDNARRQASVDASQRELARRKLLAQFGDGAARLNATQWEALAEGRLKLLRIVVPEVTVSAEPPPSLSLVPLEGGDPKQRWQTKSVWPAPAESGVPGYSAGSWYGYFAPAGTPPDVINKLNASIKRSAQSTAFKNRVEGEGLVIKTGTPDEFAKFVKAEELRWRAVVKSANIAPE